MLSDAELRELGEDIKKNGLQAVAEGKKQGIGKRTVERSIAKASGALWTGSHCHWRFPGPVDRPAAAHGIRFV
jgi:hypothetical protein